MAAFVRLRQHDRDPIPSYCDDAGAVWGTDPFRGHPLAYFTIPTRSTDKLLGVGLAQRDGEQHKTEEHYSADGHLTGQFFYVSGRVQGEEMRYPPDGSRASKTPGVDDENCREKEDYSPDRFVADTARWVRGEKLEQAGLDQLGLYPLEQQPCLTQRTIVVPPDFSLSRFPHPPTPRSPSIGASPVTSRRCGSHWPGRCRRSSLASR